MPLVIILGVGGLKKFFPVIFLSVIAIIAIYFSVSKDEKKELAKPFSLTNQMVLLKIKEQLTEQIRGLNNWPEIVTVGQNQYTIKYSVNPKLQKYMRKLLRRYKTDYSAAVVVDNTSGKILASVGRNGREGRFNDDLSFSAGHPAASLFKVVTAAHLLKKPHINNNFSMSYSGKKTTLYKYQLKKKWTRWSRYQSLEEAFASSNNVIFGKMAIYQGSGIGLYQMARKFGFNRRLPLMIEFGPSFFPMPEGQYHLAELASGFNKQTVISPLHAALVSSVVANGGKFIYPNLVEEIRHQGQSIFKHRPRIRKTMTPKMAKQMMRMMNRTVYRGTARRPFRKMPRRIKRKLVIGGKTGSITGGVPFGKRDWFTAFAYPKGIGHGGISVCVMNINGKKWYVKSAYLAQEIIEYYYKSVFNGPWSYPVIDNVKRELAQKK